MANLTVRWLENPLKEMEVSGKIIELSMDHTLW
jgi:hypothetical protein